MDRKFKHLCSWFFWYNNHLCNQNGDGGHLWCECYCWESYVKNKGFTYDPKTKDEYFNLLKKLPLKTKLSKDKIELAKKYAYHFFFRRSIEVSTLKHTPELWPNYNLDDDFYKRLLKKEDRGLDRICNSIINDEPFVYKDEIYLN